MLQDGTQTTAWTYIWQEQFYSMLYGSWDYREFRDKHLPSYLQMSSEFAEEYALAAEEGRRGIGGARSRGE